MIKPGWSKTIFFFCVFNAATAIASPATFKTLVSFDTTDGAFPSNVVQGLDGNFYGTTSGGANDNGMVFKITPTGRLTTLYRFCSKTNCTDGSGPSAGLVQGTDGNFYGATSGGGTSSNCLYPAGCGTVFKITPTGRLTTIYNFCSKTNCADSSGPSAELILGTDGNFYGTTYEGGANYEGTVYKITPGGTLTTLYSFCSKTRCADGAYPLAGLFQGTDGNFYGTTREGGANLHGTVFKITPTGALTTLYTFCSKASCTDGSAPLARLVQATDGNFYGTTFQGGTPGSCSSSRGCGTVFKITPTGRLATLYSFCSETNCTDGAVTYAAVFQGTNGNFYGTTYLGGTSTACSSLASDGCGAVFTLSVGLASFVETLPASGKIGATVYILGTNLKSASKVSFNTTAAKLTVLSATQIKTNVPNGATTGFVTVTTPGGTLKSNKIFRVIPQITRFSPTMEDANQ